MVSSVGFCGCVMGGGVAAAAGVILCRLAQLDGVFPAWATVRRFASRQ